MEQSKGMKHLFWILGGLFISGLLLWTLGIFGTDQVSTVNQPTMETFPVPADQTERETVVKKTDVSKPGTSISAEEDEARRLAYGKALWNMYQLGVLPDGSELECATNQWPVEGNRFALCDLDGDGAEELIICWEQARIAGMRCLVYTYDYPRGELRQVLSAFPSMTFYENGTALAYWSHNSGWAGQFWPFTLYQYSQESGVYEQMGSVDAWDFSFTEKNETVAAVFPREVDADGDGLIYYLFTGEWYDNSYFPQSGSPFQIWGTDPMDGTELEDWLSSYTSGAEVLHISYQHLVEENIAFLGYPEPEGSYLESTE